MSIEAMKQALDALKYHQEKTRPINMTQNAIATLSQAIEQAEKQEPVKCNCGYGIGHPLVSKCTCTPRKQWVGLTDEEMSDTYNRHYNDYVSNDIGIVDVVVIARAIEAKLKEKNSG